jgi:hypothetical protein
MNMQPDGINIPLSFLDKSQNEIIQRYCDPYGTLGETYVKSPIEKRIIDILEKSGITISNSTFALMEINHMEPTYGSFAIQFGKQISRMINNPEAVTNVFEQEGDTYNILSTLNIETDTPALSTYLNILKQIGMRGDTVPDFSSDFPESSPNIGVGWGSCLRAESKYLASAEQDDLHLSSICNKPFWTKTVGDASCINLSPVNYKGITIPPGWIFSSNFNVDDIGFIFPVRPSSFPHQHSDAKALFSDAMALVDQEEYDMLHREFVLLSNSLADQQNS